MRVGARPEGLLERLGGLAGQLPEPLFEAYFGLMAARTIMAGDRLGIYVALHEAPDDAGGLARRLQLDEPGVDVLLTALHALGYLRRRGGRYEPAERAERWLLPDSERSVRAIATEFAYDMWDHFGALEEAVRTGRPVGLHERPPDDPYWERYMRALFEVSRLVGDTVARLIPTRDPRMLVDLAGGHGGYAMALCRRHERLSARIVELEGAARIGRAIVAEEGMDERIEYVVGDLFEAGLGDGNDIVTANSIVHHFTPEQNVAMLERARGSLRPGGTMSIFELERPAGDERGTQIGSLTGVLFYITSHARTYTAAELEGFLRHAGFERVRTRRHPRIAGNVVVVGRA